MSNTSAKMSIINEVPREFKVFLYDFTVSFLLKRPAGETDFIAFGMEYFNDLLTRKVIREKTEDDKQNEEVLHKLLTNRRGSVVGIEGLHHATTLEPDHPKTLTDTKKLEAILKGIVLFRHLTVDELNAIIKKMYPRQTEKGEVIVEQGEVGDEFFVIDEGTFEEFVTIEGQQIMLRAYKDKGHFGEVALMYSTPSTVTVKSRAEGRLWCINRKSFQRTVVNAALANRIVNAKLIDHVPMLEKLTTNQKMNLADALTTKEYVNSNVIVEQGDLPNGMYFVIKGTVSVWINTPGGELNIRTLGPGDYFGEMALLTNRQRAATVRAVGKVKVAFLDAEAFHRLLGPCIGQMLSTIESYDHFRVARTE